MSRDTHTRPAERPHPRFTRSTAISRAQKSTTIDHPSRPAGATPLSLPVSRRQRILNRAAERLASLGTTKFRPSKIPVTSPAHARESSLILSSPSRRISHLPEPIKKEPFDSSASPTQKPLPSLPVVSFVPSSPIQRRSLLDAAEKPLRRSMSPGVMVDWPALSPLKAGKQNTQEPRMECQAEAIKPSLGESIVERMQKLNLNDENRSASGIPRMSSRSKIHPQDFTPMLSDHDPFRDQREYGQEDLKYLDPRPAPETPRGMKPERMSSIPRIGRRGSIRNLSILKTPSPPNPDNQPSQDTNTAGKKGLSDVAPKPQITSSIGNRSGGSAQRLNSVRNQRLPCSSIPRPTRHISTNAPPVMDAARTSPKVIKLKRAQGQITEMVRKSMRGGKQEEAQQCDGRAAWGFDTAPVCFMQEKLLPTGDDESMFKTGATTIQSTWIPSDPRGEEEQSVQTPSPSCSMIKQEPTSSPVTTPTPSGNMKGNVSPAHRYDGELSPMRTFRFPAVQPEEDNDDDQSDMTQLTTTSDISKADTIYAHDENGGYRLKPVSKADPKNGPRVRIEDSADRLLLDDEQLAEVEAKREAYQRKYRSTPEQDKLVDTVPETTSLCSPSDSRPSSANNTSKEDIDMLPTWTHQPYKSLSGKAHKAAPPVSADVRTPTHSPTRWPLLISKIAPFAEVDAPRLAGQCKSASESNLRAPPNTPNREGRQSVEESPASAYTIRAALHQISKAEGQPGDATRTVPKSQKSLPNITSRPLFSPCTSSPPKNAGTSFRKQTSGLLRSYLSQRTDLSWKDKTKAASDAQNSIANGTTPATPSPKHMGSSNTRFRYQDAHDNLSPPSNQPSSPRLVPDTVPPGQAKMMNTMRGLFHKSPTDTTLPRSKSECRSSAIYRRPHDAHKQPPLRSPATPKQLGYVAGNTKPSSTKRKLGRLSPQGKSTTDTPPTCHSHHLPRSSPPQAFVTSALEPLEICEATALAFRLLDKARGGERGADGGNTSAEEERLYAQRREGYVELARAIVSTASLARDAEKAMEEAKMAAGRAEIECVKTRRAVAEMCAGVRRMTGERV